MAGSLLPEPKQQFLNDIGVPLFAGKVYTYSAGTLTPKKTYQDKALSSENTNPVIANARGEVVMYGSGSYRIILKDALDVTIYDRDNVDSLDSAAAELAALLAGANGSANIGNGGQYVSSVAALRNLLKTSPSKYATVDGPTTVSVNGSGNYYLDEADLVTPDDNFFTIVATDGGRWKRNRLIWQTTTSGTDAPTVQIARNTSHTGGTAGVVTNALNISAVVGAGVANYEWAFLSQMDNSASAGENVAIYGQSIKRSFGPTWAGCLEIQDKYTDLDVAQGGTIGLELACSGNGSDPNLQRNGAHVAMGKNNPAGTSCEWGVGFRTSMGPDSRYVYSFHNEGSYRLAAFSNIADSSAFTNSATFLDTGKASRGVDLSQATYSAAAIQLAVAQKIAFEATGVVTLRAVAGGILVSDALFSMSKSFAIPSSGNIVASAGADTGTYLKILVDGIVRKIKLFADT